MEYFLMIAVINFFLMNRSTSSSVRWNYHRNLWSSKSHSFIQLSSKKFGSLLNIRFTLCVFATHKRGAIDLMIVQTLRARLRFFHPKIKMRPILSQITGGTLLVNIFLLCLQFPYLYIRLPSCRIHVLTMRHIFSECYFDRHKVKSSIILRQTSQVIGRNSAFIELTVFLINVEHNSC